MTRPTVAQAQVWRPQALNGLADEWDRLARQVATHVDAVAGDFGFWTGAAADAARQDAKTLAEEGDSAARAMVLAAAAARDGADQITAARDGVLSLVTAAQADGFAVDDAGSASPRCPAPPLLVALAGGSPAVADELLRARAADLSERIGAALDRLGAADADAAADISEALATAPTRPAAAANVVADWPISGQDVISHEIAEMTPEQRQQLVDAFPGRVGNTDGVPWELRIEANRTNVAQAVLREDDPGRLAVYRDLLAEVDDPTGSGLRIDRQLLGFDPARSSLIELQGNLASANSVAVFVPGLGTTIEGSAANTATARRFVSATHGGVATVTYLGGPFPRGGNPATALAAAADPRYALAMAPRLVAFSEDVDRTVDATGRRIPVTVVGHSYGGSILGTAEALGLTADRTLYVAAAGAGVGVDDPSDWHNRNPKVLRFSMTAPGDFIQAVQGIPGGPHGADPDEMAGVIRLNTGYYDDGRLMAGPHAHSDVLNLPSDSWRNILAVITGDSATLHKAG